MAPDRSRFLSYFDRDHDVLLSVGDPRAIHRDLELHLLAIGVEHDAETLQLLKDGLAALALYMVSRPRFEAFGWTFSFQEPPLNLFFTGSVDDGKIVGRGLSRQREGSGQRPTVRADDPPTDGAADFDG
jgi:hypothetical protein